MLTGKGSFSTCITGVTARTSSETRISYKPRRPEERFRGFAHSQWLTSDRTTSPKRNAMTQTNLITHSHFFFANFHWLSIFTSSVYTLTTRQKKKKNTLRLLCRKHDTLIHTFAFRKKSVNEIAKELSNIIIFIYNFIVFI